MLLYILIILFIAYLLFWPKGSSKRKSARTKKDAGPVKLVKDPVCGIYIDEREAIKLRWEGKTYYFCSNECKEKFIHMKKEKVNQA